MKRHLLFVFCFNDSAYMTSQGSHGLQEERVQKKPTRVHGSESLSLLYLYFRLSFFALSLFIVGLSHIGHSKIGVCL